MRTIDWAGDAIEIIDQTLLPETLITTRLTTVDGLIDAIERLAVRGAPALGVAGAMGAALAALIHLGDGEGPASAGALALFTAEVERIATARPTAVNLATGARRAAERARYGSAAVLAEAVLIRDEEIAASAAMGRRCADLVTELCGPSPTLLTHCNTGALAAVTEGTALSAVFELHRRGAIAGVIASETRPLLQGARLTAWELGKAGVPFRLAVDSAGSFLMARGQVDAVILGADRICASGDVVNKIGSYAHALGARAAGIPFIVVAPESTIDHATPSGADVEIEDRGPGEVVTFRGAPVAPAGTGAWNPAFDVTPAALVTAIVTDQRMVRPDRGERP